MEFWNFENISMTALIKTVPFLSKQNIVKYIIQSEKVFDLAPTPIQFPYFSHFSWKFNALIFFIIDELQVLEISLWGIYKKLSTQITRT